MDLKNIAMKIQANKYTTIAEMEEDLQLMLRQFTDIGWTRYNIETTTDYPAVVLGGYRI